MNQFDQFQSALNLTQISEQVFSFIPDSKYFVGNTPHGGYLMALMNKALVSVLPHPSSINSNICHPLKHMPFRKCLRQSELFDRNPNVSNQI